jgi:hypothetical protein
VIRTIACCFAATAVLWVRAAGAQTHTDAEKIADALRAGPDFITKDATILDYPSAPGGQFRVIRQGTSEWTCLPGARYEPACFDRTFLKWAQETIAGGTPQVDKVAIAYMYLGEDVPNIAGKAVTSSATFHVGPHVMILWPQHQRDLLTFANDGSTGMPYANHLAHSNQLFLVVPIAHADQH